MLNNNRSSCFKLAYDELTLANCSAMLSLRNVSQSVGSELHEESSSLPTEIGFNRLQFNSSSRQCFSIS